MGDMTVTVDALKETAPGETRVAVTPASVQRLRASEIDVFVERDAGAGALLPARTYTDAVLAIHAPDAPRRDTAASGPALRANHVRDQDPRRLSSTTSKR
jgi:NAD(P) transhydrogenase subunit alpha